MHPTDSEESVGDFPLATPTFCPPHVLPDCQKNVEFVLFPRYYGIFAHTGIDSHTTFGISIA